MPQYARQPLPGLEALLRPDAFGRPLRLHETVTSTNDLARAWAVQGAPEGATVIARAQTRGRGRNGHAWHSPVGLGLYLSVVLRPSWPPAELGTLAIIGGLAVAQAVEALGLSHTRIKHPNDVLVGGRKLAGVLVEPRIGGLHTEFAIMGIGVNLHHGRSDLEAAGLADAATSCRIEGVDVSDEATAAALLHSITALYRGAGTPAGRSLLKAEWIERGGLDHLPEVS